MFLGWKVKTKKPSFCWLHFLFRDCHLLMRSRGVSCWTNISMWHTCCCEAGGNKIGWGLRKLDMVVLQWLVCRHVLGQGWGLHTYILVSFVCWLVWTGLFGSQLHGRDVLKELVCAYELVFWICTFNLLSLLFLFFFFSFFKIYLRFCYWSLFGSVHTYMNTNGPEKKCICSAHIR